MTTEAADEDVLVDNLGPEMPHEESARDEEHNRIGDALTVLIEGAAYEAKGSDWATASPARHPRGDNLERDVAYLTQCPRANAFRLAIRILGERLHELGGRKLMKTTQTRVGLRVVLDLKPWSQAVLARNWEGIGDYDTNPDGVW